MNPEANKTTIRAVREEAVSKGRHELLDGLYADDYRYHGGNTFGELEGRDAFKLLLGGLSQVLADHQERVVDQIAEGDRVCTRIEGNGRVIGELFGIQGGGRPVTLSAMVISRFNERGQIAEEWVIADALDMVRQLGG